MDHVDYTKIRYDFANWPKSPLVKSETIVPEDHIQAIFFLSVFEEYSLGKGAYRKVYVNKMNPQMRVEISFIPFSSFEDAKEYLINYLARCERVLKRDNGKLRQSDLTFVSCEKVPGALVSVRNCTFIRIASIGKCDFDISEL